MFLNDKVEALIEFLKSLDDRKDRSYHYLDGELSVEYHHYNAGEDEFLKKCKEIFGLYLIDIHSTLYDHDGNLEWLKVEFMIYIRLIPDELVISLNSVQQFNL